MVKNGDLEIFKTFPLDELQVVLGELFSKGTQFEKKLNFGEKLFISFSNRGEISDIDFKGTNEELNFLIENLKEIFSDKNQIIYYSILMSQKKIVGFYKYLDKFQIAPIPEDSPQNNWLIGKHPFILQYKFTKSSFRPLTDYRSKKIETEIINVLNVIFNCRIFKYSNSAKNDWVIEYIDNKTICKFAQIGYYSDLSNLKFLDYEFLDSQTYQPMERIPEKRYYNFQENFSKYLELPSNIEALLWNYFNNNFGSKDKFNISCYWFLKSELVFETSKSLSFICLINSIESLQEKAERCKCGRAIDDTETCILCSSPLNGPTKKFAKYIIDNLPEMEEKYLKNLYDLRSGLTHGDFILKEDIESNFVFNKNKFDLQHLKQLVQYVLVNSLSNSKIDFKFKKFTKSGYTTHISHNNIF